MMAAVAQEDDEIFVYMGGNQQVPDGVRRARIHKTVKIIPARAFFGRRNLISVEFHDDIEIIEEDAFGDCFSLRSLKLLGVKIIKEKAFLCCYNLTDVEFGDKLETIERGAFNKTSLRIIRIPSASTIGAYAFGHCYGLTDVELGETLETLHEGVFYNCIKLKRIALPLKANMIGDQVFKNCPMLTTVDLVGCIHQTIASLHMESWRNEMNNEINRINQTLPTIRWYGKSDAIQQWIGTVIHRPDHFKAEHHRLLKEATTLLELALWKANLDDKLIKREFQQLGGVEREQGKRFV